MASYELRTFSLPAELEELLTAELWSLGALGFEVRQAEAGRLHLDAYFPAPPPPAARALDLAPWRRRGVLALGSRELADRDWLAPYRDVAEPFDVGRRFRLDPRDPPGPVTAVDRFTLKIPARTAFGTGSHESTRLVLAWLEDLELSGLAVLDVGTGSGILAFAATLLGAGEVVGCDLDAQAVCVARGNSRLNALAPRLFAGGVAALAPAPRFDLALVNILPESFGRDLPRLARVLVPGARVISSGNLASRRGELLERWAREGFDFAGGRRDGEWLAFLLTKGA